LLKPVGFWSYTRQDDRNAGGHLTQLRRIVGSAINLRVGEEVTLFQDTEAIPVGADWAVNIEQSIGEVTFFIPIVTPAFLRSVHCRDEFRAFRRRMVALGRDDLIFPIHYVDTERFDPRGSVFEDDLAALRRSNWSDFRPHFFEDLDSSQVKRWADKLAISIIAAMQRETVTRPAPPKPPPNPPDQPPQDERTKQKIPLSKLNLRWPQIAVERETHAILTKFIPAVAVLLIYGIAIAFTLPGSIFPWWSLGSAVLILAFWSWVTTSGVAKGIIILLYLLIITYVMIDLGLLLFGPQVTPTDAYLFVPLAGLFFLVLVPIVISGLAGKLPLKLNSVRKSY
jgi:hypothetical protein